jgi:hypothetical protein
VSRALHNTLGAVAVARGLADILRDVYRSRARCKTAMEMAGCLRGACDQAFRQWAWDPAAREVERLGRRLVALEAAISTDGEADMVTYASTALALCEDVRDRVAAVRRPALDRVIAALWKIQRYFDRRLDKWEAYERAGRAAAAWREGAC